MKNLNSEKSSSQHEIVDSERREAGRIHAIESWRRMLTSGRLSNWINDNKNQSIDFHLEAFVKILATCRPTEQIKLLDVGSGPISMFSKNFKNWNIEVHAADALANDYAQLLSELGIDQERRLVRPIQSDCESLSYVVGERSYNFVIMRNALDHTIDPVKSFSELLNVLAPGGYLLIEHFENEAKAENWEGFHQWNMWYQNNTIMLQGRGEKPLDLLKSTTIQFKEINVWRSKRISGKGWCGALVQRVLTD